MMSDKKVQEYKINAVSAVKEEIEKRKDLYFSDYRGLNVAQLSDLRMLLRKSDTRFSVVKNRYAKIALKELGVENIDQFFSGPTAIAFVGNDVTESSKILSEFSKENSLEIKGGYIDGKVMSVTDVLVLSKLPGRNELLAMLVGSMNAPARNLAYVLNSIIEKLGRTLQAVADKKAQQ